jgi:hypothetical protein
LRQTGFDFATRALRIIGWGFAGSHDGLPFGNATRDELAPHVLCTRLREGQVFVEIAFLIRRGSRRRAPHWSCERKMHDGLAVRTSRNAYVAPI